MTNYRFQRAAKINKAKAIFFTAVFHVFLLGGIAYSTDADVEEYVPDTVKEWLGMEVTDQAVAQDDGAVRP